MNYSAISFIRKLAVIIQTRIPKKGFDSFVEEQNTMADADTSRTLILIGGILQIILSVILIILGGFAIFGIFYSSMMFGGGPSGLQLFIAGMVPMGIAGIVLASFWFRWRANPGEHKTTLIITGVVCIFAGFLGGLLTLIGGAMAPTESYGEV